jgi:hypothetical protein
MTPKELARELPYWHATGRQDAGNVMDPKEIKEELGAKPSAKAIKSWLLREFVDVNDNQLFEGLLDTQLASLTKAQRVELLDAWAQGWAEYASSAMIRYAEEGF